MKIKIVNIINILLFGIIINIPYLSQSMNNMINLVLCTLILLYVFKKNKFVNNNIFVYIFSLVTILCTFINFGFSSRLLTSIVFSLEILTFYSVVQLNIYLDNKRDFLKILFKTIVVLLLISDSVVIGTNGRGIGGQNVLNYYIIGNKFIISYMHMLMLALLDVYFEEKSGKFKFLINLLLFAFCVYICSTVDCNTGILGCCIIFLMRFIWTKKEKSLIFNYKTFLVVFVGATFLLVGTNYILENEFVKKIIVDVLHRSLTLTGRLDMYNITLKAIEKKPVFGYGINSTYVEDVLKWGNAQNGLLKMLLDFGYVGTISFVFMTAYSMKNCNIKENKKLYCFLFAMAICSMVEINISGLFYLALAISNGNKRKVKKNEKSMYIINAKS